MPQSPPFIEEYPSLRLFATIGFARLRRSSSWRRQRDITHHRQNEHPRGRQYLFRGERAGQPREDGRQRTKAYHTPPEPGRDPASPTRTGAEGGHCFADRGELLLLASLLGC